MKAEHRDIIDRAKLHGLYPSEIAHELLVRDLVDTMITELRSLRCPYHLLKEEEQQEVIERATKRATAVTISAIQTISTRGAVAVPMEIKNIKYDAKAMVVTAKVDGADPSKHELTDATGKLCLLVIAPQDYHDALDGIRPEKDQKELPLASSNAEPDPETTGAADPRYAEAVAFVRESRRPAVSAVRRKLSIGYNRAALIMEAMEAEGIISIPNENGEREVLVEADQPSNGELQLDDQGELPAGDGQAAEAELDPLAGAGEPRVPTYGGHTLDDITALVLRRDNLDINWLQSRFALSTDEALAVALLLLDGNVITLDTEGETPDLNTYRVTVASQAPAEEPMTLE